MTFSFFFLLVFLSAFSLFFFALFLLFLKNDELEKLRSFLFLITGVIFFYSIHVLLFFNSATHFFQHLTRSSFVFVSDGLFLFFCILITFFILTIFLNFLYVLFVFDGKYLKYYLIYLFVLELLLLLVFSVIDLFLCHTFFDSILIPMYFLIAVWGLFNIK